MAAVETEGSLMSESRQYELMYVISPDVGEDGVAELHTQIETIVTGLDGRITKNENWGRRRLAYEINKKREGTYVVALIEGPGEIVKELDRKLKVLDSVRRQLVVRVDEDLRKADRARQLRQTRRQRRRGASPQSTHESTEDASKPVISTAPALNVSDEATTEASETAGVEEKSEVEE